MIDSFVVSTFWGFARDVTHVIYYVDKKLENKSPSSLILTTAAITVLAMTILKPSWQDENKNNT